MPNKTYRSSDVGGEVTSHSVGANVKILWKGEELERVHFPLLQVPWSFVGRLRDEAEKNEQGGMMTVDLSVLKQDGMALFNDDFPQLFREVFVRRFIPCLNEKFNERDPQKPLAKLPEDVGDSTRLLIICERLKAALKQDVKDHLDRLLLRSQEDNVRSSEGAAFKILATSLEIDKGVPPRGSLQERVVTKATDTLASQIPHSTDALQELMQMCCELQRAEMSSRIFRATIEKVAEGGSGKMNRAPQKQMSSASVADVDDSVMDDSFSPQNRRKKLDSSKTERDRLQKEKAAFEQEKEQFAMEKREFARERQNLERMTSRRGSLEDGGDSSAENSFSNNNVQMPPSGAPPTKPAPAGSREGALLALRQGVVLEKVGKLSGERIVRINGNVLEWRKGSGRFTKDHTVNIEDLVSVKTVEGSTFLLSTKTGPLTLRALNAEVASYFVQGIDNWSRGMMMPNPTATQRVLSRRMPTTSMSMAPAPVPSKIHNQYPPSPAIEQSQATGRRFPRIASMSFSRRGSQQDVALTAGSMMPIAQPPMRAGAGHDSSYISNIDESSIMERSS